MRIAVIASGEGTTLQAVLDAMRRRELPRLKIERVLSNKEGSGALRRARAEGIPAIFVDPFDDGIRLSREDYDRRLAEVVGDLDYICLMGYMRILSPIFVRAFEGRILNVHPALLPKFGGEGWYGDHVHRGVLQAGEVESGMSIHIVDELVDHGPILLQKSVPISPGETVESLKAKVGKVEKEGYVEVLKQLSEA